MRVVTDLPVADWRESARAAHRAEASGFDGVVAVELAHDPFTPLGIAALETERLELATGIAVAFPRSPTIVAHLAWDLHAQSGGRFSLGLGSQVKGHNVRRYGVAWGPPVPRLREYIEALRALWRCWETGEKLDYAGSHYQLSLMTPEFSPGPTGLPPIPITIAAVGPDMLRLAGRVCDGVRLHSFCTRAYAEQVALPRVQEGLAASGRPRAHFQVIGGGFVATGPDEGSVRTTMEEVRRRIGFYGSTRTYLPVLSMHGLEELGAKLHRHSVEGRWDRMAGEVGDDVVRLFAAVGTYDHIASEIEKRFGGVSDVVALSLPRSTSPGLAREVLEEVRRIPTAGAAPAPAA